MSGLSHEEEEYLRGKDRGFLATLSDGNPTLVPICFAYEAGVIYTSVDEKPKTGEPARLSNIKRHPHVAVLFEAYSEDWRKLSYLMIHGEASIAGPEASERARRLLIQRYPQYRWVRLGNHPVVCITVEETKFWRFTPLRQPVKRPGPSLHPL